MFSTSQANRNFIAFSLLLILLQFSISVHSQGIDFTYKDLSKACAEGKMAGKFTFVDLYAEWSTPCKEMEQVVYRDDSVAKYMNAEFVSARLAAESSKNLIEELSVSSYPTLLFYDVKGRLIFRADGSLERDQFLNLASSIVNFEDSYDAYHEKKSAETTLRYVEGLKWLNPELGTKITKEFLATVSPGKFVEPSVWQLISDHLPATDRRILPKVLDNEMLSGRYGSEYDEFVRETVGALLREAVKNEDRHLLQRHLQYVQGLGEIFPNPDSTRLASRLQFYSEHDLTNFTKLLPVYASGFLETASEWSGMAYDLSLSHFNKEVLTLAIAFADSSLLIRPSPEAFLSKSYAYDRMQQYRPAYANLLLAYELMTEEQLEDLAVYDQQLNQKMAMEFEDGVNVTGEGSEDGRFTLGAGPKRLMYGYPVPKSTSHFIVRIDGKLASNAPHLQSVGVEYLTGDLHYEGTGATPRVAIAFSFQDVYISQVLTPVDKDGKEISDGFAQYYKITYRLVNKSKKQKKAGLGLLIDTMIDDNDDCVISADGVLVQNEGGVLREGMPSELLFYRTKDDSTDMMGTAILDRLEATRPDKLVVGRWPVLFGVRWELNPQPVPYGDSAYFIKWEDRLLSNQRPIEFVTYYGLPAHKQPNLRILIEDDSYLVRKESIYFPHASSQLDLNGKMIINEMLSMENAEIVGVLLNGYTDATGADGLNFDLSERRIESVGAILEKYNIGYVPKPYGLEKAAETDYDRKFGNAWDRKVEIILYYKKKRSPSEEEQRLLLN